MGPHWFAWTMIAVSLLSAPASAARSGESQTLFAEVSPLVFQVKTAVSAEAPKATYGSGFVIDRDGLLATNYHVIAETVHHADKYRTYVVIPDAGAAQAVEGKVVGIDVLHDLALVKVDRRFPARLPLSETAPRTGARLYAVGIPQDLNLSIVDGLYNGLLKYGPYEQIQMSAPINPGMSGGPTLGADGKVIGINVAVARNSQNLTFSVPVDHLRKLASSDRVESFNSTIGSQLLQADAALTEDWKQYTAQTIQMPGWELRKPSAILKCWQTKSEDEQQEAHRRLVTTTETCNLPARAYVKDDLLPGYYWVYYQTLTNVRLNGLQFFDARKQHYIRGHFTETPLTNKYDDITEVECDEKTVINANRVPLAVKYCVRGYFKYKAVYTMWLKLASIVPHGKDSLLVEGHFDGFSISHLLGFVRDLTDSVKER